MLRKVFSAVKPDGLLLLAIENKFGLKYWSGCKEDHSGRLFDGIHGYPSKNVPITFSKKELTNLLKMAGFNFIEYYYLFPDYKLCNVIIKDKKDFKEYYIHNWLDFPFEDYTGREYLFHEGLALRNLIQADLFSEFANSFLVIASPQKRRPYKKPNWIVKKIVNHSLWSPKFHHIISLCKTKEGLKILRHSLSGTNHLKLGNLEFNLVKENNFIPGNLLTFSAWEAVFSNNFISNFLTIFHKFKDYLISQFYTGKSDKEKYPLLRGEAIDCTLWNLIENEKGIFFIDQKWKWEKPLSMDFVLFRGLFYFLNKISPFLNIQNKKLEDLITYFIKSIYPDYDLERCRQNLKQEKRFQDLIGENKQTEYFISDKNNTNQCSVILPVFNQLDLAKQYLEIFYKVIPENLFELIVINNASTDKIKEFLDEFTQKHSNVKIIHNPEKSGIAVAYNQGARLAEGEYLFFVNNRQIPSFRWFNKSLELLRGNSGIVINKPYSPNKEFQSGEKRITSIPCMVITKKLFKKLGGFDESFLSGYEHIDLCLKARKWGYKPIYRSDSIYSLEKEGVSKKAISEKKLSIIIVTYNSLNDFPACLESILLSTSSDYEVIIIDNNSTDGTQKFLTYVHKKAPDLIKVIFNEENLGFSKACNQGIKEARGKYIVLLNPDTVVTPDWDKRMIAHFADGVGAVGPVSNYVAGLQNLSVYLQDLPPIMDSTAINQISEKMFKQYRGKSIETKLLIGFCLMARKEILNKLGMLDENLFLGNDDLELSWRLRLNGYKLVVAPDVFVYHKGQASFKTKPSHETEKLVQESTDKLAEKLIKHYGFGNVPLPEELWGINWFRPSAKYSGMFKQLDKKVSIVILNYKLPEDTLECIQSIYNNIYDKFQIIVVDNGSHDGSVAKIINWAEKNKKRFIYCKEKNFIFPEEKFKQELVIIENKENLGFTGGNNIGIEYALGCGAEYIWFLNNDTVVDKNALSELVRLAELDKEIGVISSKLYFYENPTKVQYDGDKSNLYDGLPDTLYDIPRITSRPSGCSFLMRREVIESVGLWDEDYFLYFDDNDMAERAVKQGWKVFYNPYSKVYHKGAKSTGGWLASPLSVYYVTRNLLLFYYKHRGFKLEEAFSHIKDFSFQFISDPHKLYTLVKGIEDFIYGHRGKAKINFSELSKVWEKERKKTIQELIQDKSERAFQKAKRALLIEPNHTNLNEFLKIAQELALQKLEKEKSMPMKYYEQGETLYNNGQVEEAIAAFNKALDLDFSFALAHNDLAFIYWQKKDVDKALYHLSKAMELSPDNRDIIWNCGQIMLGLGYVQHAYDVYKSYLQKHPDEVEIKQVVEELDQKRMMRTGNE